ncbi:Uncharacterised protein [Serratia plymuthica]|uniref:Uncharacterized protein n=1 Tax=Serratia plymuthica TaxID=82996 RepID=A0A2X4XSN8_SERPL|nr:Uncharacterised protein [Serratia plymuthica]
MVKYGSEKKDTRLISHPCLSKLKVNMCLSMNLAMFGNTKAGNELGCVDH